MPENFDQSPEAGTGDEQPEKKPELSNEDFAAKQAERQQQAEALKASEALDAQQTTDPELAALEAELAAMGVGGDEFEVPTETDAGNKPTEGKTAVTATDNDAEATAGDDLSALEDELAALNGLSEGELEGGDTPVQPDGGNDEKQDEPEATPASDASEEGDVNGDSDADGDLGNLASADEGGEGSASDLLEEVRKEASQQHSEKIGEKAATRDATTTVIKGVAADGGEKYSEESLQKYQESFQEANDAEHQSTRDVIATGIRETDAYKNGDVTEEEVKESLEALRPEDIRKHSEAIKKLKGIPDEDKRKAAIDQYTQQIADKFYGGKTELAQAHVAALQTDEVQQSIKTIVNNQIAVITARNKGVDAGNAYLRLVETDPVAARMMLEDIDDEELREEALALYDEAYFETIPLSSAEADALLEQLGIVDELPIEPEDKLEVTNLLLDVDPKQLLFVDDMTMVDDYVILSFTNTTGTVEIDPTGARPPMFTDNIPLPDLSTASLTFADAVHEVAPQMPLLSDFKSNGRLAEGYRILESIGYSMPANEAVTKEGKEKNKELLRKLELDSDNPRLALQKAGIYDNDGLNYAGSRALHRRIVSETGRRGERLDTTPLKKILPPTQ